MEYKPLSGKEFPRFSGIKTFFRLPHVTIENDYDVALFGIPFDGGTSYRPGSRFAPTAMREISSLGRGFHVVRSLQVFDKLKVADVGDCSVVPIDLEQTYQNIEVFVGDLLKNKKRFVAVGGDHSITLPVLRALKNKYKKPLRFIHFDAHYDTFPAAWNCEYHHGSFLRHAVEEKLINPKMVLQIGIRGPYSAVTDSEYGLKRGFQILDVDKIKKGDFKLLKKFLSQNETIPTYLSFDIDCLDPAYAPGTGTPMVGGLTTYEVQSLFRQLKVKNLVGADIVEVSPAYDTSQITSLAGIDTLFEILSLMAV